MTIESGLKNKKGSAVDQMKTFAKWYAKQNNFLGYGGRVEGLDWLIYKLDEQKSK